MPGGSTSETSLYQVLLGARQLVKPGPHATYARVKRVESNPLYQGMASSADVALVELEAPVTFTNYILPVCMPDPSVIFESGMKCWVTGWGSPSEQGNE
uniref:Serine protease 27 n=1 Tax=Molossus molossus TaxID=27622 RepID=A0A7J8J2H0_MOLMO|nr:serine protease 27 [Molossus molossus]